MEPLDAIYSSAGTKLAPNLGDCFHEDISACFPSSIAFWMRVPDLLTIRLARLNCLENTLTSAPVLSRVQIAQTYFCYIAAT